MKIQLSNIKPSPNPIRKTWDKQKMIDLVWSLMEEGQVEPVGLSEDGQSNYTIVWGHRRVEAARKASWQEIEAVIVPKDEVDNLIQAGIENLSGEDMTADEKAEWAQRLINLGLSQSEISRRSTVAQQTISFWLQGQREKNAGVNVTSTGKFRSDDESIQKIVTIAQTLGNDLEAKKAVANKVSNDQLTQTQTTEVAKAYRDAPTPEVKQAVLNTPIVSRDSAADILRRSINRVEFDTGVQIRKERTAFDDEVEERRTYHNFDFGVQTFLNDIKLFAEKVSTGLRLVKLGKFTPEAAKFTIRKLEAEIDLCKACIEALQEVK